MSQKVSYITITGNLSAKKLNKLIAHIQKSANNIEVFSHRRKIKPEPWQKSLPEFVKP